MHFALGVQQIVFHQRVVKVNGAEAIHHKGVSVIVRFQRLRRERPDALVVFLHGGGFQRFALHLDFLRIGRFQPECHPSVRLDLRGRERLRKHRRGKRQGEEHIK